jgi:hypothetical protein
VTRLAGHGDEPLISLWEMEAIFAVLKNASERAAARALAEDEGKWGSEAEAAFFYGAEWAMIEVGMLIQEVIGARLPRADDWLETA